MGLKTHRLRSPRPAVVRVDSPRVVRPGRRISSADAPPSLSRLLWACRERSNTEVFSKLARTFLGFWCEFIENSLAVASLLTCCSDWKEEGTLGHRRRRRG